LRMLDQEHHQKGHDGRAGVDQQLPRIAIAEDRAGDAPDDNDRDGGDEGCRTTGQLLSLLGEGCKTAQWLSVGMCSVDAPFSDEAASLTPRIVIVPMRALTDLCSVNAAPWGGVLSAARAIGFDESILSDVVAGQHGPRGTVRSEIVGVLDIQ
jgi:hypothetical protein